jgi:isoleucyl-tRNA synthetase
LLRLWVASQEYQADVKMSERVMTQLSEAYRKIRNTFRFALGNLFDFEPERDALANEDLDEMDRWMLERTAELVKKCREWYAAYDFHRVHHAIHDYCVVDLSSFYFDVLKDRLYTKAARNRSRRSAQTAVWKITSALVRLAAPILVFTTEEIWKHLPKTPDDAESVHIARFPEARDFQTGLAASVAADWELLAKIRGEALKALEAARNAKRINSSLEAKVNFEIFTSNAELQLLGTLRKYAHWLPALLIVSQVGVPADSAGEVRTRGLHGDSFRSEVIPGLALRVIAAAGTKCERCWNYSTHVGENTRYPSVCERCSEALAEIEGLEPTRS